MMRRRGQFSEPESITEIFGNLKQSYDMARSSRYRRKRTGVVASGSGGDYHLSSPAYFGMIELARDLFRNNVVVAQGVRRLGANVVQDGFSVDAQTGDEGVDADLTARWKSWSEDPEQCDRAGELTFSSIQKLCFQQRIVDGDCIVLPTQDGSLQLHEAHCLRSPSNAKRTRADGSALIHGVLIDRYRRRQEYWLTNEDVDPHSTLRAVSQVTKYPARDSEGHKQVFHIYDSDRVSQTRGVTALAPSADTAGMGDDLFFSQLVKAQLSSAFCLIHNMAQEGMAVQDAQHGERTEETRPDGTTRTIEGITPGMEIFGFPGEAITGFSPNVPNDSFFEHALLVLNFIAINLDLPLSILILSPKESGSFSAWRGTFDQAKMRFRQMQAWLIRVLNKPTWCFKVRQWIAEDQTLQSAYSKLGDAIFAHKWNVKGWDYVQPLQDSSADLLRLRHALVSRRRWAAERGFESWEQLAKEIVADNARLIREAKTAADALNQEFPDLGVGWRELISLSSADSTSLKLSLGDEGPSGSDGDGDAAGGNQDNQNGPGQAVLHVA